MRAEEFMIPQMSREGSRTMMVYDICDNRLSDYGAGTQSE